MKDRPGEEHARIRIRITGQVQGVGFRATARRRGAELGLTGTAQNRDDGSVQIEMQGPRSALERFVAWCHEGPAAARVDTVSVTELR